MAKRKQKITTEWTEMLRNLDIGETFSCTLEEKLSVAPIATRLKKSENLSFSIKKKYSKVKGTYYEVLRLSDLEEILQETES